MFQNVKPANSRSTQADERIFVGTILSAYMGSPKQASLCIDCFVSQCITAQIKTTPELQALM